MSERKTRNSFAATVPPFIDYLKDILRRYPDGGQILKELIQNADDAGASVVVFLHDERCYGSQSLKTEGLGKYQDEAHELNTRYLLPAFADTPLPYGNYQPGELRSVVACHNHLQEARRLSFQGDTACK
ncbi:sacsin isoform X4 [Oncorhynchus tshawytscha]|uniref:sacsin isoform X4 n=1 Tax=Oncorhynchus tshawytscha TaxID=74940 RepID=UPI000D0A3697|nr:sacsin isoform X4 [Oncorhynchus tshawytscha]